MRPAATVGASPLPSTAMSALLCFSDALQEQDFWARAKAGPLRLVELMSLTLSFVMALAPIFLEIPAGSSQSLVMYTRLNGFLHGACIAAVLYMASSQRKFYEKHHDWIMIFLRVVSYPALLLYAHSPCGPIEECVSKIQYLVSSRYSRNGFTEYSLQAAIHGPRWVKNGLGAVGASPMNWLIVAYWAVLVFGPIKLFLDGLRFPLRFRHHVFVQTGLIAFMCLWNAHVCRSCSFDYEFQASIFQACQWTTLSTTGIWLDCSLAGFPMACFTFALQMHIILGLLASSYIVYQQELALRLGKPMQLWPCQ